MKLINQVSLGRGRILIDYALRGDNAAYSLEPADYVGLVAAYIAHGHPTCEMRDRLGSGLGPNIANAAVQAFATFNDPFGRGLWNQGPADDDIIFTARKLNGYYPEVDQRWHAVMSACSDAATEQRL